MRERLSDNRGSSHSGKHRAAFTALRPLIEGALAQGYTMKATWATLREEKKLSMSYQAFRIYCREAAIGRVAQNIPSRSQTRSEPLRPTDALAAGSGPTSPAEGTQRGFRHERVPRKGDIYG
jgi:hypothetical protein